jgi:aspartate kinase
MLEFAAAGARVLMARSVEFARRYKVPLHVRSSFHDGEGTWIKEEGMEDAVVSGVAHDDAEAKVTVHGVPDRPGVAASVFEPLGEAGIPVDMIVQNVATAGHTDISFTVPKDLTEVARAAAERAAETLGADGVDVDPGIAKVSIVGAGMGSAPGIAAQMFGVLAGAGINIQMISTSPIRVSCVIDGSRVEDAVRLLHDAFDPPVLGEEEST